MDFDFGFGQWIGSWRQRLDWFYKESKVLVFEFCLKGGERDISFSFGFKFLKGGKGEEMREFDLEELGFE